MTIRCWGLVLIILGCCWSAAGAAEQEHVLPGSVARVLSAHVLPVAGFSAYVHELGEPEPLLAYNDRQARNPASTIKLLTTFAGLEYLGPAYTWQTNVYLGGPVRDGTRI